MKIKAFDDRIDGFAPNARNDEILILINEPAFIYLNNCQLTINFKSDAYNYLMDEKKKDFFNCII